MQFKGFHASAQVLVCVLNGLRGALQIRAGVWLWLFARNKPQRVIDCVICIVVTKYARVSQPFYLRNDLKHCTYKTVFKYETLSLIIICHVLGYLAGVINLCSTYFAYLYIYILHVFWIYILIHIYKSRDLRFLN